MKNIDKKDNTERPETSPVAPVQTPVDGKRAFISTGEQIHKWGTYLSVDWIWNATAGAVFAYWGKFTPSGQAMWSKPVDGAFDTMLKPFIKDKKNLNWSVKQGNTFMSIIAGGMLTIPPLLVLENTNVKLAITKAIDNVIYGREKVENHAKFQQAYDEIEHAPEKDFTTGMTSRFIALAPLLASVLIPQSRDFLVKNLFLPVGKATKATFASLGLPASRLFSKFPHAERNARWNYIHDDAIAMDLSFGLPYAVMHAYAYNALASHNAKKDAAHSADVSAPDSVEPDMKAPQQESREIPAGKYTQTVRKPSRDFSEYVASAPRPSLEMGAA